MDSSQCGARTGAFHLTLSRSRAAVGVLIAAVFLIQLLGCEQGSGPSANLPLRGIARGSNQSGLLASLLTAGGYASDPEFHPQKPIVCELRDIITGKRARAAVLISGGPYVDLKGMVALLHHGNHVVSLVKVKGCIAFLRTIEINSDNFAPDSILLQSTDGWWPEANIKRYHLITLVNGKLVETFSTKGNLYDGLLGDPPRERITSLIPVSLPIAGHFRCLCLFDCWFGTRHDVNVKLWRWDPGRRCFILITKSEIGAINAWVLRWARGVRW